MLYWLFFGRESAAAAVAGENTSDGDAMMVLQPATLLN